MALNVGVLAAEHVAAGLVEGHRLVKSLRMLDAESKGDALQSMPAEQIARSMCELIEAVRQGQPLQTVGVGFPGIIRGGVVQESPNLQQVKGYDLGAALCAMLSERGITAKAVIFNDADVMAAGIAATRGQLHRVVRAWTLGNGIGFGRYPWVAGIWEGGHSVVSLDPKEHYCGCGGQGHLEGIMGHRAMRLRFLDLEPEEIFANAANGDERCEAFVKLWHRALAAATATSVHMDGPGEFYVTGQNARFVDLARLDLYLHDFVKMSPLQGTRFEVVATSDEVGVIGAAVNAERFVAGESK
ncbi:MAG TPA: ROK family protein [Terriglobia bacterium]|nr:ROK family protein [Terriglobia bacterium]